MYCMFCNRGVGTAIADQAKVREVPLLRSPNWGREGAIAALENSRAAPMGATKMQCRVASEEKDLWVTRKGATSARDGQYGIIPGSMGALSPDKGCGCVYVSQNANQRSGATLSRGVGLKALAGFS